MLDGLFSISLHLLLGGSGVDVLDLLSVRSLNLGGVVAEERKRNDQFLILELKNFEGDSHEVLEELVVVLLNNDFLGDTDDVSEVLDEVLSFLREFALSNGGVTKSVIESANALSERQGSVRSGLPAKSGQAGQKTHSLLGIFP